MQIEGGRMESTREHLPRVVAAAAAESVAAANGVTVLDVLGAIGWVNDRTIESWRRGEVECLEDAIDADPFDVRIVVALTRTWARANGLHGTATGAPLESNGRWCKVTRSGAPELERPFTTRWAHPPDVLRTIRRFVGEPVEEHVTEVIDHVVDRAPVEARLAALPRADRTDHPVAAAAIAPSDGPADPAGTGGLLDGALDADLGEAHTAAATVATDWLDDLAAARSFTDERRVAPDATRDGAATTDTDDGRTALRVSLSYGEVTCSQCRASSALYVDEDGGQLCLRCGDLDHLVFVPSGDPGVTRRAVRASVLSVPVVRYHHTRRRTERKGMLVGEAALVLAEQQALDPREAAARRSQREAARAAAWAPAQRQLLAAEIVRAFPSCPAERARSIATRVAGPITLDAAGVEPGRLDRAEVVRIVEASVRHEDTTYDQLLMAGMSRAAARAEVDAAVDQVLERWRVAPAARAFA